MVKTFQSILNIIPREFYLQDTATVAKNLLGKKIIRKVGNCKMSGMITETEAYKHKDDPASHAFRKITERNKAMFGKVGFAYVYFTYGMHYCFNVVARNPKIAAGAVLIRAIEPENGINQMQDNRGNVNLKDLTNGPAKLTQALEITREHYGVDLTKKSSIYIVEEETGSNRIVSSPRIGIKKATDKLWNFKIETKKKR